MSNEYVEEFIVFCNCDAHMVRFQMFKEQSPYIYISLFDQSYNGDSRLSFWQRLKNAWLEFKGELDHDQVLITSKEDLEGIHEKLGEMLVEWDECDNRTWPNLDDLYQKILNPDLEIIYAEEY